MRIVVQKFGGSSVADNEKRNRVIDRIIECKNRGMNVVVVLSAMGRAPQPYATDSLINLICKDPQKTVCLRDKDLLMSCGEIISCVVLAQMLRDRGHDAVSITGWQAGFITDGDYSEARILHINPERICTELENGKIPIVTGFQGISPDGEITTLGRGGSDTTATALGVALDAEEVEIYTDVDGVMTCNPRVLKDPRTIKELHYLEAGEMSGQGAKVLHKRCIAPAARLNIPLWVKEYSSGKRGTRICQEIEKEAFERRRIVTSVVDIPDMAHIAVDLIDAKDRSLSRLELLRTFEKANISLDLINVVREKLYFIVREEEVMRVVGLCKDFDLPVQIIHGCAKISCVGIGMKGTPGVMAAIQEALASAGVNILHATDSHITISLLIKQRDLRQAVDALADKFSLREKD
ncbi:MAG: aspartate kinase [Candidatus Eremiobacteraeota bacterium]|nr:aspartate kinase [Candidatus Eremiobacteraeota bacterium]